MMEFDNETDSDGPNVEIMGFRTCAEFLAMNLTLADLASDDLTAALYPNRTLPLDSCGNPQLNYTTIKEHPSRIAVMVFYPVCLAICTVGNILTFTVLGLETTKSVKRIYLMALAFSDFVFMWSQFPDYLPSFKAVQNTPGINNAIIQITGSSTFITEMFITSSDWILVAFSVERFFAVVFPLYYNIFVSKTRAKAVVCVIFVLASLYAMYNLFDYYWFFMNDDKRCPASLNVPPVYLKQWHAVYEWSVIIIPVVTFLVILCVNTVVCVHLVRHNRFRNSNTFGSSTAPTDSCKDNQAIHMLLACAILYLTTQLPTFISNISNLARHAPFCQIIIPASSIPAYTSVMGVLTNINYSVNFLLYYGISTSFRQGLRDLRHRLVQACRCGRYPFFCAKAVVVKQQYKGVVQPALQKPARPSLESCMSNTTTMSDGSLPRDPDSRRGS